MLFDPLDILRRREEKVLGHFQKFGYQCRLFSEKRCRPLVVTALQKQFIFVCFVGKTRKATDRLSPRSEELAGTLTEGTHFRDIVRIAGQHDQSVNTQRNASTRR